MEKDKEFEEILQNSHQETLQNKQEEEKKKNLVSVKFKNKKLKVDIKTIFAYKMAQQDNIPLKIIDNVYLGSIGAALCVENLKKYNITYILSAITDDSPGYKDHIKEYMSLKLKDQSETNILEKLEESNNFIQKAVNNKENILIHCFQGKSRSVTLIVGYLMKYHKMTRDQALELIRKVRPIASPNYGFMKQLLEYEKLLQNKQQHIEQQQQKEQEKQDQDNEIQDQ